MNHAVASRLRHRPGHSSDFSAARLAMRVLVVALCGLMLAEPARADEETPILEQAQALSRANAAVVGLHVEAIEDARSAATLGAERSGSGVVIAPDGLVLTIGYLILEAEHVDLLLDGRRKVPARVVAYDVATGFGLVQALVPLNLPIAPLGDGSRLKLTEPMMLTSGGKAGDVSMVSLVARRSFSGYWEYFIDDALFTSPPHADHSGAGLFNAQGELVGIGSLLVTDTLGKEAGSDHTRVPGNMFVPTDLLKPILGELRSRGESRQSERPWMGVNCVELDGQVRVLRVTDDSPADVAGLQKGDRIVRLDGAEVDTLETLWKALWQGGQNSEREVQLEITREGQPMTLTLHSVDRMKTLRHAQGV